MDGALPQAAVLREQRACAVLIDPLSRGCRVAIAGVPLTPKMHTSPPTSRPLAWGRRGPPPLPIVPRTPLDPSTYLDPSNSTRSRSIPPSAHITRLTPVLAKPHLHPNHHPFGSGNRRNSRHPPRNNLIIERAYFWLPAPDLPRPHHNRPFFFYYCRSFFFGVFAFPPLRLPLAPSRLSLGPRRSCLHHAPSTRARYLARKAPPSRASFLDLRRATGGCNCLEFHPVFLHIHLQHPRLYVLVITFTFTFTLTPTLPISFSELPSPLRYRPVTVTTYQTPRIASR